MKNITHIEAITQKGNLKYLKELRNLSKNNRQNLTKAEAKMWYEFLKNRPGGFKFTRQKPLDRFILDFYCSELLLVVEIDGSSHDQKQNYDEERDSYLANLKIKTVRFTNNEILNNLGKVKTEMMKIIQERKASLSREVSQRDGGFWQRKSDQVGLCRRGL